VAPVESCNSLLFSPTFYFTNTRLSESPKDIPHFNCHEPECPSPHFSDASLNWNSLFSQVAIHIINLHSTPPPEERKCPLCQAVLTAGHQYRAHLIGTKKKEVVHRIETVACEICWRPLRNLADSYQCHLWHHKNALEKETSPEGPPSTILSKAKSKCKGNLDKTLRKYVNLRDKIKKEKVKPNPPKTQSKPRKTKRKEENKTRKNKTETRKCGDHFSKILKNSREYFLLHKYTLVKAFYGVALSCHELNCDHIINGTRFHAFEQFKNHVKTCHDIQFQIWKYPLCSHDLQTAERYRYHLLYKCSVSYSTKSKDMLL